MGVYHLGQVEVSSKGNIAENPSTTTINKEEMIDTNSQTMPEALGFTAGVIYAPPSGFRSEPSLSIRGYSSKQIGFYLDGIPMGSPYDRQTDWSQFMLSDIAQIQVSKGYTTPIYGANTLAGAVNMVTARPTKTFELNMGGGWISPTGHKEHISLGGAYDKWYYMLTASNYMRDYFNLPSGYKATPNQPKGKRYFSKFGNQRYSAKFAYTPNATDEYAFSIIFQNGQKEDPLDTVGGSNIWRWPSYNTLTAYIMTKSKVNDIFDIKARLYYTGFTNDMKRYGEWKDGKYTNSCTSSGKHSPFWCKPGTSKYNDYTVGAGMTFDVHPGSRDSVNIAINVKNDNHHSRDYDLSGSKQTGNETTSDVTTSVALEYAHKFSHNVRFILSGSYINNEILKLKNTDADAAKHSKLNGWSLQGMVAYAPSSLFDMYVSVGKKDNVPTLKQRFSRFGRSTEWVNNSNLKTESAIGPEFGFTLSPVKNFHFNAAVYYSLMINEVFQAEISKNLKQLQNAKGSTSKYGVELGFATDFYRDIFHLMFNYSWLKHSYLGNDSYSHPTSPENIFNFIAKANPTKNIDLVLDGQFQQAYWNNEFDKKKKTTTHTKMPQSYFDMSVRVAYRPPVAKGLEIAAGVHNLLDQNVWLDYGYPVEGRNYYIEASYKY